MDEKQLVVSKRQRRGTKRRRRTQRGRVNQVAQITPSAGYSLYKSVPNSPLPLRMKTTYIYGQSFNINIGAAGVPGVHVFSANGVYDPSITGVGHQPRGFDQLMALYDHYVVIGSQITVQAPCESATNSIIYAITLQDGTTTTSDFEDILEQPYVAWRTASPNSEPVYLMQKFNPKFLGYNQPLSVSDLEGTSGQNPAEQAYFHVYGWSPQGTDEANIVVTCRIEYICMLIEPNLPAKS